MSEVFNWLDANSQVVSTLASLAMTFIWVIYLQIALTTFLRQRRPRLIVDQTNGHGVKSSFTLINLSQEPVHISCILVAINSGSDECVFEITDFEHSDAMTDTNSDQDRNETLKHGPVQAGSFLILGRTSTRMLTASSSTLEKQEPDQKSLGDRLVEYPGCISVFEIRVIGVFSTESRQVGARRQYRVHADNNGQTRLLPTTDHTAQLVSRRDRETLREWAATCRRI